MKVALVWNGPPDGGYRGVLARREVPVLRRLAEQDVRVTVVLLGDGAGLADDLADAGIPVEVLPESLPPAAAALGRLARVVRRLRPLLARLDADVVEGDDVMPAIATAFAARGRRGVVVYRRHHSAGRARLYVASRLAARLADRTVVSCEAMRRRAAADDRVSPDRIEVASSGVGEPRTLPTDRAAARGALGLTDASRVVAVVARLHPHKGVDVLLDALHHLGGLDDVHLLVVGTGSEEAALRRRAERVPATVHFLGYRRDVERWIAAADVVVMPSRDESLGRVTLETMAAGRPLVATRVGGLAEAVVDEVTGFLVPPEDPAALGAALRRVLGDRALAGRMGEAARARHQARYTIAHMAAAWRQAWERSYRSVAAPRA